MATIASLLVLLGMDTKGLTAGVTKAEGELAGLGTSTNKFGQVANAAFTGLGIAAAAGIAVSIKAASDLNEQINKSNVVFEESADAVISWSETTASSLGIAQSEALESAGAFGQLFEAAGFVPSAAAKMSQSMVQLAADLGSFNNIPVAEALEKIRGGLAGEAEPLRALGVFLSEAAVKTEAYRSGIAEQGAELTDAQKIQARYNIILAQTTKAQGDFARTVGTSIPNQLKVMKAELTDTAAAIGTDLLPGVLNLLRALKSLMPVIAPLAKNLDLLALTMGAFVVGSKLAAAGVVTFGAALGPITGIIAGAIMAGRALNDMFYETDTTVGELAASLTGQLKPALDAGIISAHQYAAAQAALRDPSMENVDVLLRVKLALDAAALAEDSAIVRTQGLADASDAYVAAAAPVPGALRETGRGAVEMGNDLSKAAKDIKRSIADEIPGIIGTVTTIKDTFTISPGELVKITHSWAQIAKRIAADLLIIAESDLKPAMREAISALPPEMRDAWARGNEKQRGAIETSIKKTLAIQDLIPGLAGDALRGGATVGKAMDTGTISGLAAGSQAVAQAAAHVIERAIDAAKVAAGSHSPSKVMAELGHDLMTGLANGISDKDRELAQKITDSISKMLDAAKSALSDFKSKMKDFAGEISGGFGQFLQIGVTEEGGFTGPDLASAQAFADALKTAKIQGAGPQMLGALAGTDLATVQALLQQGPEAVAAMNRQYEAILKLADRTGRGLSQAFFGDRMDKLQLKADRIAELLAEANRLQTGKGGDIVLQIDGNTFARITRDQLVKLGKRNVTTGI